MNPRLREINKELKGMEDDLGAGQRLIEKANRLKRERDNLENEEERRKSKLFVGKCFLYTSGTKPWSLCMYFRVEKVTEDGNFIGPSFWRERDLVGFRRETHFTVKDKYDQVKEEEYWQALEETLKKARELVSKAK